MTATIIVIALAAMVAVLAAALLRADRERRELVRLLGEANARIWNRLEWLCEDTDNRLSVDRVELQQRLDWLFERVLNEEDVKLDAFKKAMEE